MCAEVVIPQNWVIIKPGERKTLHFYDHAVIEREIIDPVIGKPKRVQSLTFFVDQEDGVKVDKMFSVVSMKLAQQLAPYIPEKKYIKYIFVIEKPPYVFSPPRLAEVRPL
ncbi:MAG: hypothetical protein QW789_03555 [Nitrososphaerota archaeon]